MKYLGGKQRLGKHIAPVLKELWNKLLKTEEFKNLKEVAKDNIVIVATGPLSSENLVKEIINQYD